MFADEFGSEAGPCCKVSGLDSLKEGQGGRTETGGMEKCGEIGFCFVFGGIASNCLLGKMCCERRGQSMNVCAVGRELNDPHPIGWGAVAFEDGFAVLKNFDRAGIENRLAAVDA